jgi:hypothetical protein
MARKTRERIPAKELREYLKLPVDQALSRRGEEVRILPDGRVLWRLVACRGVGTWPSREAYVEWCRNAEEAVAKSRSAPPPAQVLLPPIDDFIRDVEAHAKSLGPRLRIPDEVLDFTPASLDIVDKALKRIPWAKREVPDLVTPLVAYLGEVIRRGCGGRWTKAPTTQSRRLPVFDPVEEAAYGAAFFAASAAANAAAAKAAAEARARRASASDVATAANMARDAAMKPDAAYAEARANPPKPIQIITIEEPIHHNENVPLITASGDRVFHPFASVFIPMVEPSKRIPLRSSDGVPYRRPPTPSA